MSTLRRDNLRLLALAGVLAVGVSCSRESAAEAEGGTRATLATSRPAPPFGLETLAGDSLTLADLSAKKAILMNFWASWCEPCKAEIPDLIALHAEYADDGFTVLGVAVNDLPRDSRAFVEELGMTYPTVIGTPQMLEQYELSPWLPVTLLIQDGRIVQQWVGPRKRAEFEYPVKVALGLTPPLDEVVGSKKSAAQAE